jgi:hypothetical protein
MELISGSRASRDRFSIDWTLIAISALAAALLLGTTIRIAPEPRPGAMADAGGLPVLGDHQRLVSFEDFSFGPRGWTAELSDRSRGQEGVLGPFGTGAIAKEYTLPPGAERVEVSFDLRGLEARSDLSVSLNGTAIPLDREGGPGAVMRGRAGDGYAVWLALDAPGEALTLRLVAGEGNRAWSVDNVSVVVSALPTS